MTDPLLDATASSQWAFGLGAMASEEELVRLRRRELKNLLTSYADEADIFAEVNQNAMDSIQTALDNGRYGPGETPRIEIFIGRRNDDTHYYAVYDNGIGMEPSIASNFTTPGFSANKAKGKTVGYKGVGASFFAAAAEKFAVWARGGSGEESEFTIYGAHSWLTKESEPAPRVEAGAEIPDHLRKRLQSGRGTLVCYYFHSGLKPKGLSHLVTLDSLNPSVELGRWAAYLCARTALGGLVDRSATGVTVGLHLDQGAAVPVHSEVWSLGEFSLTDRRLGYPYPHSVLKIARPVEEIDAAAPAKRDAMRRSLQAVRMRWTGADIAERMSEFSFTTGEQREMVEQHLDFVDIFFGYSTKVLKEVPTRLGAKSQTIRYGVRVGVDGVPQGRMMDFAFTSNTGLERQMHAVMAFRSLELDIGRKIPADETVTEVVKIIGNRLQNHLKDYRIYLRKDAEVFQAPAVDISAWRAMTEARESNSLIGPVFEHAGGPAPIRVDPDNEQDVIALFTGLLSADFLKGLRLRALSGINQYDALVDIDVLDPSLRLAHDRLALQTSMVERGGLMRVLEFKWRFDDLLTDLESQMKRGEDIDLAVVWTIENLTPSRGVIESWFGDRSGYREIYGATHVWRDDNLTTNIPIISLKHVIAMLRADQEQRDGEPSVGVGTLKLLEEQADYAAI